MKIKKFLSITEMLTNQHYTSRKVVGNRTELQIYIDELHDEINQCQKVLESKNADFAGNLPVISEETYPVRIMVKDENGRGTCSQVKFHPMRAGENLSGFSKVSHQIEMILKHTNSEGLLDVQLPLYRYHGFEEGDIRVSKISEYFIEISKGSEYEILTGSVPLGDQAGTGKERPVFEFDLKQIVSLRKEGWFAGDFHHHSIYSSPVYGGTDDVTESAGDVQNAMRAMGLSFGALSDHHNILNHEAWEKTKTDDFLPIVSKEISTSNGHVMSMNVYEDVIYDIPKGDDRTLEFLRNEFFRITDQIKSLGGLAQINHPKEMQAAISLSEDMIKHISIFDTMEIWNGSIPMMPGTTNDQAYRLWLALLKEGTFVPATTGSDTHNTRADDYHRMLNELLWFIAQFKKHKLEDSYPKISRFVRSFHSVLDAVEIWTKENLGTGAVRTYIHSSTPAELTPEAVLDALRKGHSVLTDGPVVIPTVQDCGPGETVSIAKEEKTLRLDCRLIFNRPVRSLEVIAKDGVIAEWDVSKWDVNQSRTASLEIPAERLKEKDWLVCRILSDHTNLGIANPIFIERR